MNRLLGKWREYFEVNAALPDEIPWNAGDTLTAEEKGILGPSIAAFQLGESSDGKGLMAAAEACGKARGWTQLAAVTRFFIREEQKHAALLGRFMDIHGMARLTGDWTDAVFRKLRMNMGFDVILPVLITAEIISLVYYRAAATATRSHPFRSLCRRILADEAAHVAYEAALIAGLRKGRGWIRGEAESLALILFFLGTVQVVYLRHRELLARGGFAYLDFNFACWDMFASTFDPKVLRAPAIPEAGSWEDEGADMRVHLRWEPVLERREGA